MFKNDLLLCLFVYLYLHLFIYLLSIWWDPFCQQCVVLFSCICRNKIRPQELTGFDGFTVLCKCYTMVCSWYSIVFKMTNYLIEYFISILVSTTSLSRICFHNISSTHEYPPKGQQANSTHASLSLALSLSILPAFFIVFFRISVVNDDVHIVINGDITFNLFKKNRN